MSIRTSHSYADPSGYLTAPNRNILTSSPVWTVPYLSDEWSNVSASRSKWEIDKPEFIPTPAWAERIEGYSEEAFDISSGPSYDGEKIVVVCYKPDRTLGVGFAKVYMADKGLKNAFPQMRGVWKETKSRMDSKKLDVLYRQNISRCKIDDDGRVSSSFGIPDLPSLMDVVQEMYTVWLDWHEFPNASEFSMVKRLKQAKRDVAKMQREMSENRINGEIEDIRQSIKEAQERIVKLEKDLNDICEKAADAMNLLEENGVKVDLDDEKDEDDDVDGIVGPYADYSSGFINHAYPGQGILIDSGTMTLPDHTVQLSKEELEVFQKAWGDFASDLTVDDSVSPMTTASSAS